MLFAALVVTQRLLVLEFFQEFLVDDFAVAEVLANPFNLVQQEAGVAIGLRDKLVYNRVFDFHVFQLQSAGMVAQSAKNQSAQVILAERRKQYQLAAAE